MGGGSAGMVIHEFEGLVPADERCASTSSACTLKKMPADKDLTPELLFELQRKVTDETLDHPDSEGRFRNTD